jgi:hypothetical protein
MHQRTYTGPAYLSSLCYPQSGFSLVACGGTTEAVTASSILRWSRLCGFTVSTR